MRLEVQYKLSIKIIWVACLAQNILLYTCIYISYWWQKIIFTKENIQIHVETAQPKKINAKYKIRLPGISNILSEAFNPNYIKQLINFLKIFKQDKLL